MQHSTPEIGPEFVPESRTTPEDIVGQALGKMANILQQMFDHRTPRGEDVALE
jgi:hypothetical protein